MLNAAAFLISQRRRDRATETEDQGIPWRTRLNLPGLVGSGQGRKSGCEGRPDVQA